MIRFALLALLAAGSAHGAIRAQQIVQIPAQSQQTITALTADAQGNLIATGHNAQGAFLTKLDPTGKVVFTYTVQGAFASAAAASPDGDIYWTGAAGTPTFPFPFTKTLLPLSGTSLPGFVVKFRALDGSIAWASAIGPLNPSVIAVDPKGRPTVAGPSATAGQLQILRLTADGDLDFSTTFGGTSVSGGTPPGCVNAAFFICLASPRTTAGALLFDPQGHIWIGGSTNTIDLPVTPTALQPECGCSQSFGDGFLAEFTSDGARVLYATYLGTSAGDDSIASAALAPDGRIWIAGSTNGTDLPVTADAAQSKLAGNPDGFLLAFDPATNKIAYATYYGDRATNSITHVAVAPDGTPVFAGHLLGPGEWFDTAPTDFVAALRASGLETASLPSLSVGTGLAFLPSGAFAVAGTANVVTLFSLAADSSPAVSAVTNSALLTAGGQVSPGELVSIFGTGLGSTAETTVLFDQTPATVLYASATQINTVVPVSLAPQSATRLVVRTSQGSSNPAQLGVLPAVPGVFTTGAEYQGFPLAAALNQDGTVNTQTNRAAPGSIVSLFATGLDASVSTVLIGSGAQFLDILYAGPAPGLGAGAEQVNFRLPAPSAQTPPLILFVGNATSQYVTVWVGQ